MSLMMRKVIGNVARVFSPGYSFCHRCNRPWTVCHGHITHYTEGSGCFPLCDECWMELTPESRLPFYRELYLEWQRQGYTGIDWPAIERAVLGGN
jgi:hypothetical protein